MSLKKNDGMTPQQRYALKRKRISLDVSIEYYENVDTHAMNNGMSINEYIRSAIAEKMDRDDGKII